MPVSNLLEAESENRTTKSWGAFPSVCAPRSYLSSQKLTLSALQVAQSFFASSRMVRRAQAQRKSRPYPEMRSLGQVASFDQKTTRLERMWGRVSWAPTPQSREVTAKELGPMWQPEWELPMMEEIDRFQLLRLYAFLIRHARLPVPTKYTGFQRVFMVSLK
jgi:hypothetical protein